MDPSRPIFLYINGYPGVGKSTIAQEIANINPEGFRLIDTSLLPAQDPLASDMAESHDLWDLMVAQTRPRGLKMAIFTDYETVASERCLRVDAFQSVAAMHDAVFIPVTLTCDALENYRRLLESVGAVSSDHPLTDLDLYWSFDRRRTNALFAARDHELNRCDDVHQRAELDVTELTPRGAAMAISRHIARVMLHGIFA